MILGRRKNPLPGVGMLRIGLILPKDIIPPDTASSLGSMASSIGGRSSSFVRQDCGWWLIAFGAVFHTTIGLIGDFPSHRAKTKSLVLSRSLRTLAPRPLRHIARTGLI